MELLLTKRELIVWELMNSRTHEGGVRWVALKLGVSEGRVVELITSAERRLSEAFQEIDRNDPERS